MTLPKEKIYDEQISPLMTQIIKICKDNNIAMFSTYRLGFDEEIGEDLLCTTSIPSGEEEDKKVLDKLWNVARKNWDVVPNFMAFTITTKS